MEAVSNRPMQGVITFKLMVNKIQKWNECDCMERKMLLNFERS